MAPTVVGMTKRILLKGKTAGWSKEDHEKAGFRMVPNSPVRKGSFVGKNAVLNAMLCKYWSIHRRRNNDGYIQSCR